MVYIFDNKFMISYLAQMLSLLIKQSFSGTLIFWYHNL
jgi:hypothetical protein